MASMKRSFTIQKIDDFLLRYDYSIKEEGKHMFYWYDADEYILSSDNKEEFSGTFFQSFNYVRNNYIKNTFSYKGENGFIGLVSLLDSEIEEIISATKVFEHDSHHVLFLSKGQFERVENGESSLFVVINKKVMPYFTHELPNNVIHDIEKKITIL